MKCFIRSCYIFILLANTYVASGQITILEEIAICQGTDYVTLGNEELEKLCSSPEDIVEWFSDSGHTVGNSHIVTIPAPSYSMTFFFIINGQAAASQEITVAEVGFFEIAVPEEESNPDRSKYGFDDTGGEAWKTIEVGKTDKCLVAIDPSSLDDDFEVSLSGSIESFTFGTDYSNQPFIGGHSFIGAHKRAIDIKAKNTEGSGAVNIEFSGEKCKQLNVDVYTKKMRSVAVILMHDVNKQSTDIPLEAIEKTLNEHIYNQAVFEWNVRKLPAITLDYDKNNDGILSILEIGRTGYDADEEISDEYDDVVFIVDELENDGDHPAGFHIGGTRYSWVNGSLSYASVAIAHELGHSAFDFTDNSESQENNLMNYVGSLNKISKSQWRTIQQ